MPASGSVKLVRVPKDLTCSSQGCGKTIPFGAWAHYSEDSKQAICLECGAKRNWTDKQRADLVVKKLELQEDIKALRKRQKFEADALFLLQEQVDLHRLGERYFELERKITASLVMLQSYLNAVATSQEKQALERVEREVQGMQDLQQEIKKELESRLFLLERAERRKKMIQKVIEDADEEQVQEAE